MPRPLLQCVPAMLVVLLGFAEPYFFCLCCIFFSQGGSGEGCRSALLVEECGPDPKERMVCFAACGSTAYGP